MSSAGSSSGERDITLATADRIATALGLIVVHADELPAARPAIDRRDFGAMRVGSVETNQGRRAVATR